MPFYLTFLCSFLNKIPWEHWVSLCAFSLLASVFISVKKRLSVFAAISLGISVLMGLLIIEMIVIVRFVGIMPHAHGVDFLSGFSRFFYGGEPGRREILANVFAFLPFGFFLSEFFSSEIRYDFWRVICHVATVAFGFSLCIECLQLILKVVFFELTDLLMNTLGAVAGASISLAGRILLNRNRKGDFDRHIKQNGNR